MLGQSTSWGPLNSTSIECVALIVILTHWGLNKMDDNLQTEFSNAFHGWKVLYLDKKKIIKICFNVQSTTWPASFQIWFGARDEASHFLNHGDPIHGHTYIYIYIYIYIFHLWYFHRNTVFMKSVFCSFLPNSGEFFLCPTAKNAQKAVFHHSATRARGHV